ncbi:MAG TPA: hypothetical protein VN778_05740 [Verrucomicrobiae bacterium]|nr:hypothetical protein [Verrucomicrobiae bacterium]
MQHRKLLASFLWRFAVCLTAISLLYLLVFGLPKKAAKRSSTNTQRLASIRAALDETYIAGRSLATLHQTDASAYEALNDLHDEYQTAAADLAKAVQQSPATLTSGEQAALQAIVSRNQQASASYTSTYAVLNQVVRYNPSDDLNLPLNSAATEVAARASAAQRGLTKAATPAPVKMATGNSGVQTGIPASFDSTLQAALQAEAQCFGQLASRLNAAHTLAAAGQTRTACLQTYPALRLEALQAVTGAAFTQEYQDYLDQTVPPLLKQMDSQIRSRH